ncbi:MAG: hypothetical protein ACFFD1_00250 [Candidatus Thorarchaeota archaeon]
MDIKNIIKSRKLLIKNLKLARENKLEAEGGCGVIGIASTLPINGESLLRPLKQMRNRGNGKGGGLAIFGLSAKYLGVTKEILEECFIIQIAYLDESCRSSLENKYINEKFIIKEKQHVETIADYKSIELEIKPPKIVRYFVTVKSNIIDEFMIKNDIKDMNKAQDEFVYQNTYLLNKEFYSSIGEKQAFVLSHGKNMLVFKIVGYAEDVINYYKLEKMPGYIWIGHHRYPTKGVVWHPGGAHPFIGLNDALVHNGDFSNYQGVSDYLAQFNIYPLFLTDTEVAAYLFDLYSRVFQYPTEYVIEALAPTTERDFYMLDKDKQDIYQDIQISHINGSPDGPWFFIIGRSQNEKKKIQLLGITDTSMLRPQVFAIQETDKGNKIGLIGSERQAIDALLSSLSETYEEIPTKADFYWNARGGSYTDGGAFIFDVDFSNGSPELICKDKFGKIIPFQSKNSKWTNYLNQLSEIIGSFYNENQFKDILIFMKEKISYSNFFTQFYSMIDQKLITIDEALEFLTILLDTVHLTPLNQDGRFRSDLENTIFSIFRKVPTIKAFSESFSSVYISFKDREAIRSPLNGEKSLIMDVSNFPAEGLDSAAQFIVKAYELGWKQVYSFDWRGQRFAGSGLGPNSEGFRLDIYGNPGDYLASGVDGAEIFVHCSAQDQVGQLFKKGKLVIYGDVGQAFLYGAKGGSIFVLGNTAGRPLINAVGNPRVVINGTCLDYLAESFMAGDPLTNGGFVILNGIRFTYEGKLELLGTPYSGGNLFSLASGGAIYLFDPHEAVSSDQLHGGQFIPYTEKDETVIMPYIKENEKLFYIPIDKLTYGSANEFTSYNSSNLRKISPVPLHY